MADRLIQDLEHASRIVLAPPNLVTSEQRHAAENVFMDFKRTEKPYNTCRFILENSSVDYVLFQAATTIKESVVREWSLLDAHDIESLRSFLVQFITRNVSLQSYVRETILQTVAVILKRGALDASGPSCDSLFHDVTELIGSGNVTMQLVACSMLSALLNEFSSSSLTSSIGLTWEFHAKCKQTFEGKNLRHVFMFSLQVLHEIESTTEPLSRETTAVLNKVLSIAEQVLSWEFIQHRSRSLIGMFSSSQNVPLRPNDAWREVLLGDAALPLFFRIHQKVRHNSEMAHHSMMCISQLASLNGSIFLDDRARIHYLCMFVDGFMQLLNSIDIQDYEYIGIASTFKNIVMMFPLHCVAALPDCLLQTWLKFMTTLTCNMGHAAAEEECLLSEDSLHMEAYEKLLDTWLSLVSDTDQLATSTIKPFADQIFSTYMMCHISPPNGNRLKMEAVKDKEIGDTEEDDREKFSDQLCSIGALARVSPEHTLTRMAGMLEDLVVRYHGELQHLQQHSNKRQHEWSTDTITLDSLHEDLHWALMVTTYILTEGVEGETPLIPSSIMACSVQQNRTVDLQNTLQFLVSSSQHPASISGDDMNSIDKVIRLISILLRLAEVENCALREKLSLYMSPQLASTIMWSLRRWAAAYLLPNEKYYSEISPALKLAFGHESSGVQWTVDFLLQKILLNVRLWSAETQVMADTLQLLVTLVDNKARVQFVVKSQCLWQLAQLKASKTDFPRIMVSNAHRLYMKGLVLAGSGLKDVVQQQTYWKLVLETSRDCLYFIVSQEDFTTGGYRGASKDELILILEALIGIAQGTRADICEHIFAFLYPQMIVSIKLLELYHNYEDMVLLILELFAEVVQHHLCYLSESSSKKLFEVSLSVIEMYSKYNSGVKRSVSEDDEENKFNDISIVMDLLMNLLAKDFVDFGPIESDASQVGCQVEAASVVFYGLEIIIPLMSADLLKFPLLCSQYFKLISFLSEIHADKFTGLAPPLFKSIVASLEMGLKSFGSDITKLCLETLACLATNAFQKQLSDSCLFEVLGDFLELLFNMLLLENFDMNLLDTAGTTLFCLICYRKEKYQFLVNQLLEQHVSSEHKQRLLEAFTSLTPASLQMNITRQNKIVFRHNFDSFIINVRGFLCVR